LYPSSAFLLVRRGDEKGEFAFELECELEVVLDGRGDVLLGVLKGLLGGEKE